jgi:hypothetical protein
MFVVVPGLLLYFQYDLCMPESVELSQVGALMNSGCERGSSDRLAKVLEVKKKMES